MNVILLFEQWVEQLPDGCAVREVVTGRELTYRQLWQSAGRFARRLRADGVRPGDVVGLAMDRSLDLVVALVAVLRAGGAYLPHDAQAPAGRIVAVLAEAGVRLVVQAGPPAAADSGPRWPLPPGVTRLVWAGPDSADSADSAGPAAIAPRTGA